MIAQVPATLTDAGSAALAVAAILSLLVLVSRLRPARWLWRTVVGDPISAWFRLEVTEAVKEITAELVDPKIAEIHGEQQTIRQQVDTIADRTAQLVPNNGSHLADTINRTEAKLGEVEERLDRLDETT